MNEKNDILNLINLITNEKEISSILETASESLRADKEVVLEAVKRNGLALEYASEQLKDDKEVVLEAIEHSIEGIAFKYASERLKDDKEVVLKAVKKHYWRFETASER